MDRIFKLIAAEREALSAKWGSGITRGLWLAILTEKVGRVAEACLVEDPEEDALVQVAAVVVAWLEALELPCPNECGGGCKLCSSPEPAGR